MGKSNERIFLARTLDDLQEVDKRISEFTVELTSTKHITDYHRTQPNFKDGMYEIVVTWVEDNYKLKTKFN